jgi:L-malate glycosyltransferase
MKEDKGESSILSPMATGNGAYVVHSMLEKRILNYHVFGYNPYWEFFPFFLPLIVSQTHAKLVHTTADFGFFFKRPGTRLVLSFQNYVLDRFMKPYSTFLQRIHYKTDLRLFTKLSLLGAHSVTAVSHFTAELVRKDLKHRGSIKIIYNGVDAQCFCPSREPKTANKTTGVLFSGNLTSRKGAHLLPLIAESLTEDIKIYFTAGLRTKNTLLGHPKLRCLGTIPHPDMPHVYQQMDMLLMPTVREGLSLSVLEAMACGLPVVASDCSSLPELIDNGKGGFLCPVGDVAAFAEKINFLAQAPELRRQMGEYNRAKVEKMFTLERMVSEYRELFESLL